MLLAAALVAWMVSAASLADTAAPAVDAATPASAAAAVASPRAEAFALLLKGDFPAGQTMLDKADPADPAAKTAKVLTGDFLKLRAIDEQEHKTELAGEVKRVQLGLLAEKNRAAMVKTELGDKVFKHIENIAEAVSAADKYFNINSTSQPQSTLPQVKESMDKARKEIDLALADAAAAPADWAKAFGLVADELKVAIDGFVAQYATGALPQDWRALKMASAKVQDRVIDMGVLVSHEPLMVAMAHAREAKELTNDDEAFLKNEWVQGVIRDAEARGKSLEGEGKWLEALGYFGHGGLLDLDHDNKTYSDEVKRISLRARQQNLYAATTKPATTQASTTAPADEEPRWQEMIEGIDAATVRNVISQIDDNYVERPDYRRITTSALEAVKLLAQTPKAEGTFPSLGDKEKKDAFVTGVEKQMEQIQSAGTVDHLDLALALKRTLELNTKTIDLPPEVIDMEFTEGMTSQLDDFSAMIWPYEEVEFRKRTMGSFFGIGVQIRKDQGLRPIEVVTPLPDTPAFRAGILAGDQIIKVDGKDTESLTTDRAVKLITGPRHTKVTLTIRRPGRPQPFDVDIERDEIQIETIKGWRRLADGKWDFMLDPTAKIGYIRITQFTEDTTEKLHEALKGLKSDGCKGVIIDVRFDPGGLLKSAIDMADEFLSRGLIVSTKSKRGKEPESEKSATALGEWQDGQLICLVNELSASASEILSGALKDWGRATIVGKRSFGKGSVQRVISVKADDRAKLKLTTAYYYLPSGRCLHRINGAKIWGVDPDVPVDMTVRQMSRWGEVRQETDLIKEVDAKLLTGMLDEQLREDIQLREALLLMQLKLIAPPS
jgi:carboxyl-terminal processing protease